MTNCDFCEDSTKATYIFAFALNVYNVCDSHRRLIQNTIGSAA